MGIIVDSNLKPRVHKGSTVSSMYAPDVCKVPETSPVPLPYPNFVVKSAEQSTKATQGSDPTVPMGGVISRSSGNEAGIAASGLMSPSVPQVSFDVKAAQYYMFQKLRG